MAIVYDTESNQYVEENDDGSEEVLLLLLLLGVVDRIGVKIRKQLKALAALLIAGDLSSFEFESKVRELLQAAHIVIVAIAAGGIAQMTKDLWAIIADALNVQYEYLRGFEKKITAKKLSEAQILYRSQLYASSLRVAFFAAIVATRMAIGKDPKVRRVLAASEHCTDCVTYASWGFIPLSRMPAIGDSQCGQHCKCHLEFEHK